MNLASLLSVTSKPADDPIIAGLRRRIAAYSESEARDNHGKWTTTGDQLDLPIATEMTKSHTAEVTDAVQEVAKQRGFPLDKVIVTQDTNTMTLNGSEANAAGLYDSKDKTITIYPKEIPDAETAKGVMAHEIEHHMFDVVERAARDQYARMITETDADHPKTPEEIAKAYPLYSKLNRFFSKPARLAQEDGVSRYSRQYWEGVLTGDVPLQTAVHETLGEIARIDALHGVATKAVNNDFDEEVGQHWRKLFTTVNTAYTKLTKTKKIAAAVTQATVNGEIALIAPYNAHLLRVLFTNGNSAFVTRTIQAYSESEARDKDGKWTTGGDNEIFVSPNVKENLGLQDAIRSLASERQTRFEAKARDVVAAVAGGGKVEGAIGVWADGAENSTAITVPHADSETLRYTASLLGKSGDQKAVLAWTNAAGGPHALYTLSTSLGPTQVAADSLKLGIAFQTIIPSYHGGRIQILDQDGALADKVQALGSMAGYKPVGVQHGSGEFIGSWTSRDEGNAAYDQIIQAYEKGHQGYKGSLEFSGADGNKGWSDLYRRIAAAKAAAEEKVEAYSDSEARDNHGEWTDGGDRAAIAKRTYNPATLEKQTIADEAEMRLSKSVGIPRTKDNSAFDLVGKGVAVEVKTLVDRKRNEITMHPDALRRKQKEARKTKVNAYTVVMDERPGQNQVYWKAGVGSFTLSSMNRVSSVEGLRKVLVAR